LRKQQTPQWFDYYCGVLFLTESSYTLAARLLSLFERCRVVLRLDVAAGRLRPALARAVIVGPGDQVQQVLTRGRCMAVRRMAVAVRLAVGSQDFAGGMH